MSSVREEYRGETFTCGSEKAQTCGCAPLYKTIYVVDKMRDGNGWTEYLCYECYEAALELPEVPEDYFDKFTK